MKKGKTENQNDKQVQVNINKKVKCILDLVFELNNKDRYDAFFRYSGHIDSIEVTIQECHDYIEEEDFEQYVNETIYLSKEFYLVNDRRLDKLNELQNTLSDLLNSTN